MRKLLISVAVTASLLAGCAQVRFPWVQRIDVPQGNVLTREQVDQLRPGMTRAQVQFLLGSPLLTDPYHPERWEYVYRLEAEGQPLQQQRLTLIFQDDRVVQLIGGIPPRPEAEGAPVDPSHTVNVTVPPDAREKKGLLERLF